MRQIFINGEVYDIPANSDGSINADTVRRMANIPSDRALVLQNPNGSNHVINAGEDFRVRPGQHMSEMNIHKRGGH